MSLMYHEADVMFRCNVQIKCIMFMSLMSHVAHVSRRSCLMSRRGLIEGSAGALGPLLGGVHNGGRGQMQSVIMHISADLRSEIHCRRSSQRTHHKTHKLIIHITHSGSLLSVSVSHLSSAHHQSSVSVLLKLYWYAYIVRSGGRVSVSAYDAPLPAPQPSPPVRLCQACPLAPKSGAGFPSNLRAGPSMAVRPRQGVRLRVYPAIKRTF
jgi:hypothetical protein